MRINDKYVGKSPLIRNPKFKGPNSKSPVDTSQGWRTIRNSNAIWYQHEDEKKIKS